MSSHSESEHETKGSTAESTHFRGSPAVGDGGAVDAAVAPHHESDAFLSSPKSIRLHTRTARGGLAVRLAIPIVTALVIGFVVISLILVHRVSGMQMADLRTSAANGVYLAGVMGRILISHRDAFIRENPDYPGAAEWRTGSHWLAAHGFVDKREWSEATGFDPDELAPVSILEDAGRKMALAYLSEYLNASDTDIAALYIVDADGTPLVANRGAASRFEPLNLKSFPVSSKYVQIGDNRVMVDYVPEMTPEPVVRGVVKIMDADNPEKTLGTAVLILRVSRQNREQGAFIVLLASLALALLAFMGLVCWRSARRVTAPMRRMAADMQAIAEGDFARRSPVQESNELGLLAQAFNSMAERLRIARMNERETSRLESDLAIARHIQNTLLPPQTPRVRGLDMHTSYRPAKEIGGDYFDFLPVDEQHMGLVVADASGKSIPAALVMSTTRAILRFVAPGNLSASDTLGRVNSILSVDIPKGMFVTAYYVILDPLERTMLCASAGHTPLLIARADDSVEILNPGGIALGFDGGPIFQRSIREQRVKMESGDRVLLYTDGVVECVNASNEEYSDRRLREFLRRNRELSSHDFVGALLADLDRHRGLAEMRDDTTIVTFRVL